jgi:signal transduction histidine kinase
VSIKSLSLRTSALIALVLPILIGAILFFILIGYYETKSSINTLNLELSVQSKVISDTISEVVLIGDYATLEQILHKYTLHPEIKLVEFTTKNGIKITQTDKPTQIEYPEFLPKILGLESAISETTNITIAGVKYGTLTIDMDKDEMLNDIWSKLVHITIILLIVLLSAAILLISLLNATIIPSLRAIKNASLAIEHDNYKVNIDEDVNPELKQVLVAFNNMAQSIEAKKESLKALNQELKEKAEQEIEKREIHEKILVQQSKMAMMGEMIGAIAHQWRQPLNSLGLMIQDIEMAQKFGELDDAYISQFKENSMAAIKKMSNTIDDFRNFFRQSKIESEFSLEQTFEETLNIMQAQLNLHNIKLNFTRTDEHIVNGYKSEFEHVILILLSNAKDALIENEIQNPYISVSIFTDKKIDKIVFVIEDNGKGVPVSVMNKIFEPYFTTKEANKGTGIGLYLAKEIVEKHMGGKIYLTNTDVGAKFTIELNK